MGILDKKEKKTPKTEGKAPVVAANELKPYKKFQLVDNGHRRAKVEMFRDHRDGKDYPELDKQGRKTVFLEKELREVTLNDEQAAVLNSQAINSRIIYLESRDQKQFDHPVDPSNKMFNIVNEIGK